MAATTKFIIEVVADPRKAVAGQKRVDKALDKTEKEALDLKTALQRALSTRDQGLAAALGKVNSTLERTEQQALITSAKIGQIGRDVQAKGVEVVNDKLGDTERRASKIGPLLKRAFAGVGIALLAKQFFTLSDELTNVQNRLRLVTENSEDLVNVQQQLFDVSNATRSSFEGTATIFTRLAQSSEELGKSNQQLLNFTKSLNQAIILSGASAVESKAGLIQLSQGLAAGALRGDELRSVLEQLPAVSRVIAKDLGVTIGQLRLMGQEGKITSDVIIGAFERAAMSIDKAFATTVPTVGQSFVVLQNKILQSVGAVNEVTGVSKTLARGILLLGENIDTITIATSAFATALSVTLAAKAIPRAVIALGTLKVATIAATGAFVAVAAAIFYASRRLAKYNEDVAAMEETARQLAIDEQFALGGQAITGARQEIKRLNAEIKMLAESGITDVGIWTAKIEEQEAIIAKVTAAIRSEAKEIRKANAERREAADSAERQRELLEKIRAPIEKYGKLQSDVAVIIAKGNLELRERDALLKMVEEARPKGEKDPFAQIEVGSGMHAQNLVKINEQMEIMVSKQGLQRQAALIELKLRKDGIELTSEQKVRLDELLEKYKELTAELERQKGRAVDPFAGSLKSLREIRKGLGRGQ